MQRPNLIQSLFQQDNLPRLEPFTVTAGPSMRPGVSLTVIRASKIDVHGSYRDYGECGGQEGGEDVAK